MFACGVRNTRLIENIVECKDIAGLSYTREEAGLIENIVECKVRMGINMLDLN